METIIDLDIPPHESVLVLNGRLDTDQQIKVLVSNSVGAFDLFRPTMVNDANVTIYGRSNLNQDLLTLTATVNDSTVSLIANAHTSSDSSELRGSKIIFSANYYQNQNIPVAGWKRFR